MPEHLRGTWGREAQSAWVVGLPRRPGWTLGRPPLATELHVASAARKPAVRFPISLLLSGQKARRALSTFPPSFDTCF